MFRAGDRIMCVDAHVTLLRHQQLCGGMVYTVKSVEWEGAGVTLHEISGEWQVHRFMLIDSSDPGATEYESWARGAA